MPIRLEQEHVPALATVQCQLSVKHGREAVEFYKTALGASNAHRSQFKINRNHFAPYSSRERLI